jgi:Cu/Ag efflux protein CusF
VASTANPHGVTKAQVGLSDVDNTADSAKPISTATQAALDGKANASHTHTAAQVTDLASSVSANSDVAANTAARHNHANIVVLNGTTASFTTSDEAKLDGIATGATVNSSDATLLNRANHTGSQSAATISDFSEVVRDTMGAALVGGTNVTITPNDAGDTITIAASAGAADLSTDPLFLEEHNSDGTHNMANAPDYTYPARNSGGLVYIPTPFIDPEWFGADPTGVADSTAAAEAAVAQAVAEHRPLRFGPGQFRLNVFDIPDGAVIESAGIGHTQFLRSATGSTYMFKADGTFGSTTAFDANAVEGAISITTTLSPGLAVGDYVLLRTQRQPWGAGAFPDYDIQKVKSVTGSGPFTVTFEGALARDFAIANTATIQKINPCRVRLHDIDIIFEAGATGSAISNVGGINSEFDTIQIAGWRKDGLALDSAMSCLVHNIRLLNPSDVGSGNGYGVLIAGGARHNLIEQVHGENCRHTIVLTAGAHHNRIQHCVGIGAPNGDFDLHGHECRYNHFYDCTAIMNASPAFHAGNTSYGGDQDTTFEKCVSIDQPTGFVAHFSAVQGSHRTRFINCEATRGYRGIYVLGSNDCQVLGGRIRLNSNAGVRFDNAVGGVCQGITVENPGTHPFFSQGATTDYLHVANNVWIGGGNTSTIVGAGSLNVNNMTR